MPDDDAPWPPAAVNGLVCAGVIGTYYLGSRYLRRVRTAPEISEQWLKKRRMLGKVVSVNDGDDFRFFHTPGGYLAGWGWLRRVPPTGARGLRQQTIHVRLNGIDAPEGPHFGKPGQKYYRPALEWLRAYILGRRVVIEPLSKDQYQRVVAEVRVWKLTGRKNVSKEILKAGWATVYEAKTGSEFNGNEALFRRLEAKARQKKRGMFERGSPETPAEYKRKYG